MVVEKLFLGAEKVGRGHDVVIASRSFYGFQICIPVDGRREFADLRQSHLMIDVLGIATLDVIHLRLGHGGLKFDHGAGVGCGLGF